MERTLTDTEELIMNELVTQHEETGLVIGQEPLADSVKHRR